MKKFSAILYAPLLLLFFTDNTVKSFSNVSAAQLPVADLLNNSMDVVSADIDKDGDEDLIIASEFRQNLILINDGKGKFSNGTEGRLPRKNHDSEDIAVADFDKDGDLDIIFVSEDDRIHEYYLNDGKGFFTDVSERLAFQSTANSILEGDFDKDGDIDIIIGNEGQDYFYANDGKGNFKDETALRLPVDNTTTQDIEAADVDGDKDLDLVFGNEDGNKLYLNNGKGLFTDATQQLALPEGEEETRKVDIADIDKDGDLDIFFSNVNFRRTKNSANRVLVNDGKGNFTDQTRQRFIADNNFHTADAQFIDLDGDGYLDLIVANIFGGSQQILLNDRKGNFHDKTQNFLTTNPTTDAIAIETGDWNKDGKTDLYYGVFRNADILMNGN
ncbi:MAG TPA: VCBS repeat-containing protein [Chitinophagaceae bacterium]